MTQEAVQHPSSGPSFVVARTALACSAFVLAAAGVSQGSQELILGSIVALVAHNLAWALVDPQKRIVFGLFQLTFFLFLTSRMVVFWFKGEELLAAFAQPIRTETLTALLVAAGAAFVYCLISGNSTGGNSLDEQCFTVGSRELHLRTLSFWALFPTFAAQMMVTVDKASFRAENSIYDYYASYSSTLPGPVVKMGDAFYPVIVLFLATLPSKRQSTVPIALFLIVSASSAMYGVRNVLVLNLCMLLVYAVWRNSLGGERWISRGPVVALGILAIPFTVALQAFDAIRREGVISFGGLLASFDVGAIPDFMVAQGGSVDVIASSIAASPYLGQQPTSYSFGGVYSYLTNNVLTSTLFGSDVLAQNSFAMADHGVSLGSRLAYLYFPTSYVQGVGMGSSFVAELLTDWGYIGVFLGTMFLCVVMGYTRRLASRGPVAMALALLATRSLLYSPRGGVTDWISYSLSFWNLVVFAVFWFFAAILSARKSKPDDRFGVPKQNVLARDSVERWAK